MRGRLAHVAVFLGACYSAPEPNCGFVCGPDGACPDDYTCASDNICHRNGSPSDVTCPSGQTFDVLSVTPADDHHAMVLFDAAPDPTSGSDPANYAIAGLTISAASVTGATVTLTTSTQSPMTYTLVAANITRASDGIGLTNDTATFTGIAAFDVASAMSVDVTTLTVTFDAAPDATQATTLANYAVDGGLTLSGTPTLAGDTVTLTTAAQAVQEYTVTVTGVTRATDHESLDTDTAMFAGRDAFLVASAASTSNTSLAVTFSAPPDPTAATTLANYNGGGLVLSGTPVLAGSTVTITTASQTATVYTVTVHNVTRASDAEPLGNSSAMFTGRTAFIVMSAFPEYAGELTVLFSDTPDPTAAGMVGNYACDGGLVLSSVLNVTGAAVQLATAPQNGGTAYTVTVSNITRMSDGEALDGATAMWTGVSCMDSMQDGDETDTDCGGSVCPQCITGDKCLIDGDCQSNSCSAGHTCN